MILLFCFQTNDVEIHLFQPTNRRISDTVGSDTYYYIPESYSVPADKIMTELENPHTQERIPVGNIPHIWGQSLYILSSIIYDGLLLPGEIDPLGRRMVSFVWFKLS